MLDARDGRREPGNFYGVPAPPTAPALSRGHSYGVLQSYPLSVARILGVFAQTHQVFRPYDFGRPIFRYLPSNVTLIPPQFIVSALTVTEPAPNVTVKLHESPPVLLLENLLPCEA